MHYYNRCSNWGSLLWLANQPNSKYITHIIWGLELGQVPSVFLISMITVCNTTGDLQEGGGGGEGKANVQQSSGLHSERKEGRTMPELRQDSSTLMWTLRSLSQVVSELFIHSLVSAVSGTSNSLRMVFWIATVKGPGGETPWNHIRQTCQPKKWIQTQRYSSGCYIVFYGTCHRMYCKDVKFDSQELWNKKGLHIESARLNFSVRTFSISLWRHKKISTGYTSTLTVLGKSTTWHV